jgi:predicted MFS family arabinose efflux permease
VIYSGVFLIVLTLFQPETLRSLVGNGSTAPYRLARNPIWSPTGSGLPSDPAARVTNPPLGLRIDFIGPLRILFFPEVFCVLLFLSIHYASWQMALTAQSSLFSATYGLGELEIGLTFLANGFGCILGTLTTGKLLDRDYRRLERKFTGSPTDFPIERARLRTVWVWSPIQWGSVLLFGWTLDKHVHIAAPVVASFTLAWSAMSIQAVITTFIVDIFPKRSASATAALNMARCLMGAGATASVDASIRSIGVGWTFTLWTGLMVISISLVGVQIQWGAEWRKKREENERHAAAEAENQPKS